LFVNGLFSALMNDRHCGHSAKAKIGKFRAEASKKVAVGGHRNVGRRDGCLAAAGPDALLALTRSPGRRDACPTLKAAENAALEDKKISGWI
jgi:hypothetical protein